MKSILLRLIKIYQIAGPFKYLFRCRCRFYPTCSEYAYESIDKHGIIKGCFCGLKRLLKCHPFHYGGYDPVK